MIYFYSGTPGSGKSLEVAKDIRNKLCFKKQNVIANFEVDINYLRKGLFKKKRTGCFYYFDNTVLTVDLLLKYARKMHKPYIEGQTLLVIDEAQVKFSPSAVKLYNQADKNYRQDWLNFFTQHRKLGYTIIIISQFDRLIDAQIRCLFEYNQIHRKVNNFKIGWLFSIFHISLFISVTYWYGVHERIGSHFFFYSKSLSKIYNSYKLFDNKLVADKDYSNLVKNQ